MIRILVLGLFIYIGYRIIGRLFMGKGEQPSAPHVDQAAQTYQDPICGIYVSEDDAVIGRLDGERYFFCSKDCLEKFQEKLEHK